MLRFIFKTLVLVVCLGAVAAGAGGFYLYKRFSENLPDYSQLADYAPPTVTRVHAGDGRLLAEYATEKRVFVPIDAIPRRVIGAFLSAEDKRFYEHPGINVLAIARAAITNLMNVGTDRRLVGGSTITQQVAKNFLLTNERSWERKVKEAILAYRIEQTYSKDKILELYLNEIYLGQGSYGVAAAALNYFNKSLDELTIAEAAYLGALPKAPSNYHPVRQHDEAVARRNWVIGRMVEDGLISAEEGAAAQVEPLTVHERDDIEEASADYYAEEVRRDLVRLFGEDSLYTSGLSVRTSLDVHLQSIAERVLQEGLLDYDRRHGWRGPVTTLDATSPDWPQQLGEVDASQGLESWRLALVGEVGGKSVAIGFADGSRGTIPFSEMTWARPWKKDQRVGAEPSKPGDVLNSGDVVFVEKTGEGDAYALRQPPDVNGGIVALDPHTGRVLALSGGFSYQASEFNRATQAARQPGSSFKPFVYLAALENGFTPTTIVLDAPFVIDQGGSQGKWKPSNYSDRYYGPSTMRLGIEKSRNLMTVRLAQMIGMDVISEYAARFGVIDDMPPVLSMALGAGETTLLRMTAAYGMIVNGGRKITPSLIDRVQDRFGRTLYRHDQRACELCTAEVWRDQPKPDVVDGSEQIVDPGSAYQMTSMLEGVILRGTGSKIADLGRPLGGKTGTTNQSFDSWFVGFSPDLAVGVYAGFDNPRTLGPRETGSSVAAPIFKAFMRDALEGTPPVPFRIPPDIHMVRVDAETGVEASADSGKVILEAFKPGTGPNPPQSAEGSSGSAPVGGTGLSTSTGVGGLY